MEEPQSVRTDELPSFGYHQFQGIHLEIQSYGFWEPFQLFYFDEMLDKEQNYYIKSLDDLKGYRVLGKIKLSANSDTLLRATYDMLRVKPSK